VRVVAAGVQVGVNVGDGVVVLVSVRVSRVSFVCVSLAYDLSITL
jgi:hypothetical protein